MFVLPDNPYDILGVAKNAQIPEIRSAHRKLVLKCHPDKVTDLAQKAIKQEEFQKVQKAYEMLSDERERQKYDDMVRANDMERENDKIRSKQRDRTREATPGQTPPRYDSDYGRAPSQTTYKVRVNKPEGVKIRTAEPSPAFTKGATFPAAGAQSPYASTRTTPPHSWEDNIHYSSYEEGLPRESRRSRKPSVVYEEKLSSREEERRRRKQDEEWDRAQEKSRRKEAEKREAERKEQERREKDRKKEEKRRAEKEREKARELERKRESEEKRARQKSQAQVYVEDVTDSYVPPPPKSEKKSKSSSRSRETIREMSPPTERTMKADSNLEFAAKYLQTSRSKVPGLSRAKTYHPTYNVRSVSPPPIPVATPPPAAGGLAAPPGPFPQAFFEEEEPRRRRASHDSPRGKEKSLSSSHKKSNSREAEYVVEAGRPTPSFKKSNTMPTSYHQGTSPSAPDSPPRISRSQTDQYSRPTAAPVPGLGRSHTWIPGEDERDRAHSKHVKAYVDDDSDDEPRHHRRSRRTHSPEGLPSNGTFKYTVHGGRALPVRGEPSMDRKTAKAYYAAESNTSRPLDRPPAHAYGGGSNQLFDKVKTASYGDVLYGEIPHANYRGDYIYSGA